MTMLPSRRVSATFVAVFVIGAAVGALLYSSFEDVTLSTFFSHTSDPMSNATRLNQKYVREYHLTPEELTRISPLTREMSQQMYQSRRHFSMDIMNLLDDYHHKIAEQMTPAHRAAYEEAIGERRKKVSAALLLDSATVPAAQK